MMLICWRKLNIRRLGKYRMKYKMDRLRERERERERKREREAVFVTAVT